MRLDNGMGDGVLYTESVAILGLITRDVHEMRGKGV